MPWNIRTIFYRVAAANFNINKQFTSKELLGLRSFNNLERLYLNSSGIGEDEIIAISKLHSLRVLRLDFNSKIKDEDLSHLVSLRHLELLRLDHTGITDNGWQYIEKLSNLQEVSVSKTSVTINGIQTFRTQRPKVKVAHDRVLYE